MTEMIRKALLEAETYIGDRSVGSAGFWDALEPARKELDVLSSVPEDVARDAEAVRYSISGHAALTQDKKEEDHAHEIALPALSRLATAAARVPGLEAELKKARHGLRDVLEEHNAEPVGDSTDDLVRGAVEVTQKGRERQTDAESERDAARQETEKHRKGLQDVLLECSNFREENARLTARVAELESSLTYVKGERAKAEADLARYKTTADSLNAMWEKAEARATAVDARVAMLHGALPVLMRTWHDKMRGQTHHATDGWETCAECRWMLERSRSSEPSEPLPGWLAAAQPTPAPGLREPDFRERLLDLAAGVLTEERVWWPLYIDPNTMEARAGDRGYPKEQTAWSVANRHDVALNTYVAVRFGQRIVIYTGPRHVLCKRDLAAVDAKPPTFAPGLREAVGPRITPMERLVDVARRLAGGANTRIVWDDLDAALAAYDSAPGGETCGHSETFWDASGPCGLCGADSEEPPARAAEVREMERTDYKAPAVTEDMSLPPTPPSEPTVTHAQLAAVVEAYALQEEQAALDEDAGDVGEEVQRRVARHEGRAEGAREVLRRVTGGEVPESLPKARVVEVLTGIVDWCRGVGMAPPTVTAAHPLDCATCCRVRAAASALGLTLPTGPGGGGPVGQEPDTFSQAFSQGVLQAIEEAQTGVRLPDVAHIGPGSEVAETMRDAYDDLHQQISEQRARIDAARAEAKAHPEPDASEDAWEGDGVLVDHRDTVRFKTRDGRWVGVEDERVQAIGRALAEARREMAAMRKAHEAAQYASAHCSWATVGGDVIAIHAARLEEDTDEAARKAAQDMRERAVQELVRHTSERCDCDGTEFCLRNAREAIRALPLE